MEVRFSLNETDGLQYFVTSQTFTAAEVQTLATYAVKSFQLLESEASQTP